MSDWGATTPRKKDKGDCCYCPGCGAPLYYPEGLTPPELLKHIECKTEWLLIVAPEKAK
jgi:hypothetical protein